MKHLPPLSRPRPRRARHSDPEAATNISALPDEAVVAAPEVADVPPEAADAHDEAVLDMVAFEMAAPDPSDTDDAA